MHWCWTVGRLRGTPIRLHGSLALTAAGIAAACWLRFGNAVEVVYGLSYFLVLLGFALTAQLGQATAAGAAGVPVRDITLTGIGGFARLDGLPERARDQWLIGLAGPVIGVASMALLAQVEEGSPLLRQPGLDGDLLRWGMYECGWYAAVSLLSSGRWCAVSLRPLWIV